MIIFSTRHLSYMKETPAAFNYRLEPQKKIDIHCHTTPRKLGNVKHNDASMDRVRNEACHWNIEKTVLLASYFPHKGTGISNYRLADWIWTRRATELIWNQNVREADKQDKFLMFGSLDIESYFLQGMNELEELASKRRIQGIKIYTGYQNIDLHGQKIRDVLTFAQEQLLPVAFHCGYSHGAMRTTGKPSYTDFVKPSEVASITRHYDIPTIICHMGKPFLDDLIQTINTHQNIYTDMSGLLASKYEQNLIPQATEEIRRFLGECGPEHLLFGTDFPVQTHHDSIRMLDKALEGYSPDEKDLVYYKNVEKMLRLE